MRSRPCQPARTAVPLAVAAALMLGALPASAATFNWTAGTFVDGVTAPNPLPTGDTLVLGTASTKGFVTSFTNNGTVAHQLGGGALFLGASSTLTNNGLWDEQGANVIGVSTGGFFVNNGVFRKSGAGLSSFAPTSWVNHGTIDIQQGAMSFGGNATNAGLLTGSGLINSFAPISNAGILAPGSFGAGTLTLNGNYIQQANGTLAVDLTNMASKDLFAISGGSASLDGTLALNCLGACSFSVGDSFTILSSLNARSGTFASVTLSGFATGDFDVVYGNNSVSLVVTQAVSAVPEPETAALWLAGLAGLGMAARRRPSRQN